MGYIAMFIGAFIVSAALSYAWWIKVRVIDLRQDIFDIRDELFDQAVERGWLSDPAYRAARTRLNSMAANAHTLSVPVLDFLARRVESNTHTDIKEEENVGTSDEELRGAIHDCKYRVAERLNKYIFRETLCGIAILLAYRVTNMASKYHNIPQDDSMDIYRRCVGEAMVILGSDRLNDLVDSGA